MGADLGVLLLDADGEELRRVSLLEAVANSEYAGWLEKPEVKR